MGKLELIPVRIRPQISEFDTWVVCPKCSAERVMNKKTHARRKSDLCGKCARRAQSKPYRLPNISREQDERDLAILLMYERSVPVSKIAKRFGLTRGAVSGIVHRCLRGK